MQNSTLESDLREWQLSGANRLLLILKNTPFPNEGVPAEAFDMLLRLFIPFSHLSIEEFASRLSLQSDSVSEWMQGKPPQPITQKCVADWMMHYLEHMVATA